jgi:DNA-binding CsgD family transcriptional regulator/tetratricopeptide (TPR) repeat protein
VSPHNHPVDLDHPESPSEQRQRDNETMPRRAWDAPLVGRTAELASLDDALQTSAGGSPAVVLIAGEAGIGKSRLAAEAATRALANGWQLLSGGCLDLAEGSVPYLPLVDALHDLPPDALPPLLMHWVRGEAEESPLTEGVARGRIYAAYLDVLRSASVTSPLALIVEDVHWADRGTRDLLSYLVRALTTPATQARVLILLTYRSDEFRRGSPVRRWLGDLARRPLVSRVDVTPLDRAQVARQLAALGTFDSRAAQEIFLRSEGNPFYVEELATLWATGQPAVPEVVRDAAEVRLASLPNTDRDVIRMLATLGRPASFDLIHSLTDRSSSELVEMLRRAVDAGLLTVDPQTALYRFRHALLAEAVAVDFLPGERTALHQAIARSLELDPFLSTGPGELAYHQAWAGDSDAALVSYLAAADAAARIYAFGDAAECLQRALELWSRVSDADQRAGTSRGDLLSRSAEFVALVDDFDRATALAQAALAEPDVAEHPQRRAEVWRRIAWYRVMASDGPGIFAAFDAAAAALETAVAATGRARLAAEDALVRAFWSRAEARGRADRALALADAEGDLGARGVALNARGCVRSAAGDSTNAVRDLEQALDLARSHGTDQDICRAILNLAATLVDAARYGEGLALCEAGIDEATSLGLALPYTMLCRNTAADALFALGRWPEAVSEAEAVLRLTEDGQSARMAKDVLARTATRRGDSELAGRLLSEVPRYDRVRDEPQLAAPAWLTSAELCSMSELFDDGRAAVAAGLELVAGVDVWLTAQLCAVGVRLEADRCISARRRRARSEESAARQRGRELVEVADASGPQEGSIGAWIAQAHAEFARIGDGETGSQFEAWAAVRDRWHVLGHRYDEAYAGVRLAEAMLMGGSRREAEAEVRRSESIANQLGARPLAALVADVRLRAGLDASPALSKDGLTRREREILGWVAQGATNRDIAEALFISPKTVSVHVSALLRKFGVSGRGDLHSVAAMNVHRE